MYAVEFLSTVLGLLTVKVYSHVCLLTVPDLCVRFCVSVDSVRSVCAIVFLLTVPDLCEL